MAQQFFDYPDNGDTVKGVIDSNFAELYASVRDASVYGFSTSATAAVNVAAVQAAFDVGGTITIITPGEYELDDTLKIGSNTKLICCPGVIFKKTGDYSNVLINKGAETRTYNENIHIQGLTISVNGVDNLTDLDVLGLRAQVGLFYVKNLNIYDFRCEDLESLQFCFQINRWENLHFKNIVIEGDKDGLDIGVGNNGLFENVDWTTHDDAIALYTSGYPSVALEIGDVYNVTFRNCNDYVKDGVGFTCRMMIASWDDWTNGNTYKNGDICVNAGNAYTSNTGVGSSETGTVAPVHSSGEVLGADNIRWRYLNACDFYFTEIYDIVFDNCTYYDVRTPIDVRFIDDANMRSVYPGTETLSSIYNVKLINSTITGPDKVIGQSGNLKDIVINNCEIDGARWCIFCEDKDADSNPQVKVIMQGNSIKNMANNLIANQKDGQEVFLVASGNVRDSTSFGIFKTGTATVRMINLDLQFPNADLNDLSPEVGDTCMTTVGFNVYKAAGWFNLAL